MTSTLPFPPDQFEKERIQPFPSQPILLAVPWKTGDAPGRIA